MARWLAGFQGVLYLVTGLWPAVHLRSFLAVTGPKTDLWLVVAFGLLTAAVGIALLYASVYETVGASTMTTGFAVAAALAFVDFYYAGHDIIADSYMIDGVVEAAIALSWMALFAQLRRRVIARVAAEQS